MTPMRFLSLSALALLVCACGEASEPDLSPYAGDSETPASQSADLAEQAGASGAASADAEGEDEADLRPTDLKARELCNAVDGEFANLLDPGTAFAARGGDGRVFVGWNYDGATEQHVIFTPDVPLDDRLPFDLAVGDFQRWNMERDAPNRDLTGADRKRDGGLCVLQTESAAIEPLIAAWRTLAPKLENGSD